MKELWMKPYETTNEPDWMDDEPNEPETTEEEMEEREAEHLRNLVSSPSASKPSIEQQTGETADDYFDSLFASLKEETEEEVIEPETTEKETEEEMTYTETHTPEEVSLRVEEGVEIVKNAMIQVGLTATDETVNDLLSRSLEERKQVWNAIFGKMQIGMKSFAEYLEESRYLTNATPETVEAMKTLHEVLNFDADTWLEDVCNITAEVLNA